MSTTHPEVIRRQRGLGIVAALVITIVLAGLAVLLARTTSTQAASVSLDERGVRAYWAARAGLDWGSWQIRNGNTACAGGSFGFPPDTSFRITVTCSGDASGRLVTARACAPAADCDAAAKSRFYVERVITRSMP